MVAVSAAALGTMGAVAAASNPDIAQGAPTFNVASKVQHPNAEPFMLAMTAEA
jgi:hypothetical protein